jgi:hypothetical protein
VGAVKRKSGNKADVAKTFSGDNLVPNYMIGLDLIVCKVWVDFTFKSTLGNK